MCSAGSGTGQTRAGGSLRYFRGRLFRRLRGHGASILADFALLLGVLRRSGRRAAAGLSAALLHLAVGGFGAGCMWEAMNLNAFSEGRPGETQSFPVSAVRDVRIGRGWARKGLWLVVRPYVGGIDALAEGHAVSFEAPDDRTGGCAVYALHLRTPEDATRFASLLRLGA